MPNNSGIYCKGNGKDLHECEKFLTPNRDHLRKMRKMPGLLVRIEPHDTAIYNTGITIHHIHAQKYHRLLQGGWLNNPVTQHDRTGLVK